MELFCTDGEWNRCKTREKRCTWLFRALAWFTPALFFVLCLFIRTGNTRTIHPVLLIATAVPGAAAIIVWVLFTRPARQELKHLEMLRNGSQDIREGTLTVTRESFRIPKSVRVRRVILETGEERPSLLNVDERWVGRMPPDGSKVRLAAVHSYIAGAEICECAAGVKAEPRKVSAVRTFFRGVSAAFPLLVLWAFAVLIFGSFIFYQITDTSPAHKITLYVDGVTVNENQLAELLEKQLPDPIRMVRIHPFSYQMFGTDELKTADLYIIPDSRKEEYRDWFVPDDPGIPVYDPETGLIIAGEWFRYVSEGETAEPWRLYTGAGSAHLEDGLAAQAAQLLISVTDTAKEETP